MWLHAAGPQVPWEQTPMQQSPPELHDDPSGRQTLVPHNPFVQTVPGSQHGRDPSQAAPKRTHAPPHSPPRHAAPEQQVVLVQMAPSGMQAGGGLRQRPSGEHACPEQQGIVALHWPNVGEQPPQ